MTVHLVGAGPGDPGLLTRRGAELLAAADVVLYDRLVSDDVLALARDDALLLDVGKRPRSTVGSSQDEINELLVGCARCFDVVVRLKGGDPFLFGRGAEELEVLERAGVACEVVPGLTSAFGVPAVAGISVTSRGVASSVTVVTGHDVAAGSVDWARLGDPSATLVVLMATSQLDAVSRALLDAGRPGTTPCAVIERGTTPQQRVTTSSLDTLGSLRPSPPAVLVVGEVVAHRADTASREVASLAVTAVTPTRRALRPPGSRGTPARSR